MSNKKKKTGKPGFDPDQPRGGNGQWVFIPGYGVGSSDEISLDDFATAPLQADAGFARGARLGALREGGYTPAIAIGVARDARESDGADQFWADDLATSQFGGLRKGQKVGTYLQMPDNYTPKMSSGRGTGGHRRTYRRKYENETMAIRMPSAASVKRFAAEHPGETFDIPVDVTNKKTGATMHTHVRVTQGVNGAWSTHTLGMRNRDVDKVVARNSAQIAEAVQSTLEARHPATGMRQAGDLAAKRAARLGARGGAATNTRTRSSAVGRIGYDDATGRMFVQFWRSGRDGSHRLDERVYTYRASRADFESIVYSDAPGRQLNQVIAPRRNEYTDGAACPVCGRFYVKADRHACFPPVSAPRPTYGSGRRRAARKIVETRYNQMQV